MKLSIIGPSGSGKSTLARKIATEFKIPRLEIDRLWFKHGGHQLTDKTSEAKELLDQQIRQEVTEFLNNNEAWVIEGVYASLQPLISGQAGELVYLKRSLLSRLFSHITRVLKGTDRHPEITRLEDLRFTKSILRRWYRKLDTLVANYDDKLITLDNFKDIDTYFDTLVSKYQEAS